MTSLIGWVDYSEDHRRRMREVIDLFRDHDTIDELGIGQVRDALADAMFPGLTTIQTRARYFLFVSWVGLRLERDRVASRDAERMSRRFQHELVTALKAGGETGGQGVIGYDAGFNLQRLPSVVYWQGLGEYGIRRFHGSLADYHRSLDGYRRRLHEFKNEDGGARGDGEELADRFHRNWDAHLPEPPPDLWTETTLELTPEEAEYLVGCIRIAKPGYLLSHLLDHLDQPLDDTRFPWEHPAVDLLPSKARNRLDHARLFSEVMHGAPLLYNLMLGELKTQRGLNVDDRNSPDAYRERLEQWAELIDARSRAVHGWDIADFWLLVTDVNPNISNPTRQFIDTWIRLVRTDLDGIVSGADHVRTLIADRERRRKGAQARLFSDRALELWSGAAGTARLAFRWPTAVRMLTDIKEGFDSARP